MNRGSALIVAAGLFCCAAVGFAGEIDYVEDFALAKDRPAALKQLIPGTEDYYYYNSLHLQNTEQYDKVEQLLVLWIQRHGRTARVVEVENRQALLTYPTKPAQALEFLRQRIGIHFNHQRELLNAKPNLPIALDQKLIGREALVAYAVSNWPNTVEGFENASFDWLLARELNPEQRRNLLSRLARPDYPNLVKLIADDLTYKYSQGFGAMNVHRQLLTAQLEELLKLRPELLNQTNFVNIYLTKLQPSGDLDWRHDAVAYEAYLDRMWAFVSRLAPAHNSLKAHVLYQRLEHDRTKGVHDKDRFLAYLKLPRNIGYVEPKWLQAPERRDVLADLNADYRQFTLCLPIGNDETLVRAYFAHFFLTEASYQEYVPFVQEVYLKHLFAETKIVNGLGEPEQWYSLLPPEKYQALKERIDIDFAPTNKSIFGADEAVSLDLFVKNVPALIVKVYEVNTFNFYRANLREVDTDINLDGLVANDERTQLYTDPPLRRVARHFEFAGLNKAGTYVIDFIGNGKSSRALVRKGKLHYIVRSGVAGQVFTVFDEANRKLPDASIWIAGREYKADAKGAIAVPYSNNPSRQAIILSHGGLNTLESFSYESESYNLTAGIIVDRQSLLNRRKAKVVIRPSLTVNGTPVSLKILEEVQLRIISTDLDGVSSSSDVPDFKLLEDREASYEFQVPDRLASIRFVLTAKVQNLSQNKKNDLAAEQQFGLNEIDRTDKVEDLHFTRLPGGYAVDLLGKTGESKIDRPVQFVLKHKDFKHPVHVTLQCGPQGRINLGPLADIVSVTATGPEGTAHTWNLLHDRHSYYSTLNGQAGQPLEVPYMGAAAKTDRALFSLLEVRGQTFVVDRFEALSLAGGMLKVAGLEPGDYDLWLKESDTHIRISVTAGAVGEGYVLGAARQLELRGGKPLQIVSVTPGAKGVKVQLANATRYSRVHVFVDRYHPAYDQYDYLSVVRDAEPYQLFVPLARSAYVEGRNIGDEYRYILDRKYAPKFAGNMLARPSLLLNPFAIRKTETAQQDPEAGEEFLQRSGGGKSSGGRGQGKGEGAGAAGDFADLDFLAQAAAVLINAVPDEKGAIEFSTAELGGFHHLHIVAVDPEQTAYRQVALPEQKADYFDLRLATGLDPKIHYTQQKQVTIVAGGKPFVLADIASAKFEAYDSLSRVYGLYMTLTGDAKLAEFSFVLGWPKLKPEEKQKLYSKYACHELNFFLMKKDPEFFRDVVLPYTKNKRDKTFLDHWLVADAAQKSYLSLWNHEQLNIVERVLLAQRVPGEMEYTSRQVQDLFSLVPPNIDEYNRLFTWAIRNGSLETGDRFGIHDARDKTVALGLLREELADLQMATPAPANDAPGFAGGFGPPAPPGAPAPTEAPRPNSKPQSQSESKRDNAEQLKAMKKYRQSAGKDQAKELAEMDGAYFFDAESERRAGVRQLYQKLDKTQEWVENNYYHLAIEEQNAALVQVNAFWRDYSKHDPAAPFLSPHFAQASRNFTEMMFALSVLDLPFEAGKHDTKYEGAKLTLTPAGPVIAFHEEIRPARSVAEQTPILVSQNFFRYGDRHRTVDNEQVDKYVTEEFLVHVVYGCQIVVTNPTSSRQKLEVLIQVPVGALPVLGGQMTKSVSIQLEPFHTQTVEYHFYFPRAGAFTHYPVQVAKNEELLASATPFTFKVVNELSKLDTESWDYVSQHGTDDEVVTFLKTHNLYQINLDRIAWRMHSAAYFRIVTDLLAARHAYNHTLWSYGLKHDVVPAIRQYLQHADGFLAQCGAYIDSPLVTIDPVARKSYQHMDYAPLVNARAHALGRRRQILNDRFFEQYHRLMNVLKYRRDLNHDDWMSVTYYMLLQDRVAEALDAFGKVNPANLETRLQYDYFAAYLDFYTDDHKLARGIALKYLNHPVNRWREAFTAVVTQLDELEGKGVQVVNAEDRNQAQTALASTEASFEFKVESKKVVLTYQHLDAVTVNYYLMDVELLFSRNPFVQQFAGQFSYIRPNGSQQLKLPPGKSTFEFELPEQLHNSNVLVEIVGAGQTKTQAYYSNSLAVTVTENYGQLKVADTAGKALPKVYVKVYAEMQNGEMKFYKDGYTDLRGRFDYSSLNTNELDYVKRFSLLVMSEQNGAVVKEAAPPKR